ncbi:phage BR0599 family protein [Citrobacter braakii]|uniref:baseplate hub domain-containing protein n=1 Tax=Citrobacter braakii TaxID=57706 RepID=UPI0035263DCF
MSWNNYENSTSDGLPVTLFDFIRSDTVHYRFTNADQTITANNETWEPAAVSAPGISTGTGDTLDITVPANSAVAALFRGASPSLKVRLYRLHADDELMEIKTIWIGTVYETKWQNINSLKLITYSIAATFNRNGLRLTWGRPCPYSLYDKNCRVNRELYAITSFIESLDGASINIIDSFENGWLSGGYIEWVADGITERRGLKVQNGRNIGVIGGTHSMCEWMEVTLFPGCERTINICNSKFNNVLNYGGQPHMPGKSPYEIMKLF